LLLNPTLLQVMKKTLAIRPAFLYLRKFEILEFQPITYIYAERQQCDCNLGDNTAFIIFDESIVATNVDYSTEHYVSP